MSKRLFQRVFALIMMCSIVLGQTSVILADDFSSNGSPKIIVG